ncbi:hypothetical protein NL676_013606 [Syzygium grande]|nr:hypothetical protein NL676_013606 [Syzygium grande]
MVCLQFTDRLSMGEEEMKLDFSSLRLLADVASLICKGKLGLASAIFDRDDEKKETIVTTPFLPTWVGWVIRKKRSPRARRLTFHAQKLSSDPVGVVVDKNKNKKRI